MAPHVALLGDSVFDNKAYTGGEPDVASHLRGLLPSWNVTLCAIDGSTTHDVGRQLDRVPKTADHLVMSLGGNDAIMNADLLDLPVSSTAGALETFHERLEAFETSYGWALDALKHLGRMAWVCTIYNGNLGADATRAKVALMMFNDVIIRSALSRDMSVLELRLVCTEVSDFANPIEPSGSGGLKIAAAIRRAIDPTAPAAHRATLRT